MIKMRFQAWDPTLKTFRKVSELSFYSDKCTIGGEVFLDGERHSEYFPEDVQLIIKSNHTDLEGNVIKESDILEMTQFDKPYIVEVYWDEVVCGLRIRTKDGTKGFLPVENPKIIGNIFQSPEKFI